MREPQATPRTHPAAREAFTVSPTDEQCLRIADALLDDNVAQAEVYLWAAWHPTAEFPDEDYSPEEKAWATAIRTLRQPAAQDLESALVRLDQAIRAETTHLLQHDDSAARDTLRSVGTHLLARGHTILTATESQP
ncbi:hypothetical protein BAY59_33725 [Prauserella coralliicola]|nr:hypothetical protein BAY59_33725 [Prauserella coralliicola]